MFFRNSYSLAGLEFIGNEGTELAFNYSGAQPARVWLLQSEQRADGTDPEEMRPEEMKCLAEVDWPLSEKLSGLFSHVLQRKLPPGSTAPDGTRFHQGDDGPVSDKYWSVLELWPQSFREFVQQVEKELFTCANYVVRSLAWRLAKSLGRDALTKGPGLVCSPDRASWTRVPHGPTELRGSFDLPKQVRPEHIAFVEGRTAPHGGQPLAHELLAEACDLRYSNPRSSLILAVAAAEVGLKELATSVDLSGAFRG